MFPQIVRWMKRRLGTSPSIPPGATRGLHEAGGSSSSSQTLDMVLAEGHSKLASSLKGLTSMSEREIGAVGQRLGEMVTVAIEQSQKLEQILTHVEAQEHGIASLAEAQMCNITAYKTRLLPMLAQQQTTLVDFKNRAGELREAEVSLRAIRYQTWLLTMFTEVEGTRFGDDELDPTHMLVQLDALVQEVRSASTLMGEMRQELSLLLEELIEHSQEMGRLADTFLEQVNSQTLVISEHSRTMHALLMDSAQKTSMGMNEVVSLSQAALSKLQFHDPMIQQLQSFDSAMADCRNLVLIQAGEAPTCTPLIYPANLGQTLGTPTAQESASMPQAGDVMFL